MHNFDARFLHLRQYNINGELLPKGGITAGWILTNKKLKIAYSVCSDNDRYNRSIGRNVVLGRIASKEKSIFKYVFNEAQMQSIINQLISPAYFIHEIEFDMADISNTFIIRFIKDHLTILLKKTHIFGNHNMYNF